MFIFCLFVFCTFSLLYNGEKYLHRTAYFGAPMGSYNITSEIYFLRPTTEPCIPYQLLFDIAFINNQLIFVPSSLDQSTHCSDGESVASIESVLQRMHGHTLRGIIFYLGSGFRGDLPVGPDGIETRWTFPIVYVDYNTFLNIATESRSGLTGEVTLSIEGDKDSDDIPSNAPSLSPSLAEIEAPRKNVWWWLSATTLQDWLFLLFGFLCVILLLLIFLKFYKLCRRRVNNSVVIRNLRVRRIERIPTLQYGPSKVINESCVICLDDFEAATDIKVLNCRHGYHPRCIDIWLMQSDKCPLCNADAIKNKKRIYDACCCFCYRNADNFGFHGGEEEASEPDVEMEMNTRVQNVGGNSFEDHLIQH